MRLSYDAGFGQPGWLETLVVSDLSGAIVSLEILCVSLNSDGSLPTLFFFFQAEDGIRDLTVTGVQTCALPICPTHRSRTRAPPLGRAASWPRRRSSPVPPPPRRSPPGATRRGSSHLQRGERDRGAQHAHDVEPHDDLRLRPAELLKVVMQRRHPEDAVRVRVLLAAARLVPAVHARLQHHRDRLRGTRR